MEQGGKKLKYSPKFRLINDITQINISKSHLSTKQLYPLLKILIHNNLIAPESSSD